jgi:hypothetical protein
MVDEWDVLGTLLISHPIEVCASLREQKTMSAWAQSALAAQWLLARRLDAFP